MGGGGGDVISRLDVHTNGHGLCTTDHRRTLLKVNFALIASHNILTIINVCIHRYTYANAYVGCTLSAGYDDSQY